MLFHYTFRGFAADNYSILSFPSAGEVFKYGYVGIDLFLMISGYVMFISAPSKGLKDFIVSRVSRLYPVFWIAVSLTAVTTLLLGAERFHVTLIQYIANLTMLNQLVGINSIDGAWWFMLVVLTFNLIIAVLILFKLVKYQEYFAGIWLMVAFPLNFFHLPVIGSLIMPAYAPFFIAGIIFQSAKTKGWNLFKYIVITLSLFYSLYLGYLSRNSWQAYYHHPFSIFIISALIILFYLAFYVVTIRKRPIKLPKIFVLFGAAAYPLYLIHQNIGYMLFDWLGGTINKYVLLSMTSIIMIGAAIIIAKYIEPYVYDKLRRTIEGMIHSVTRSRKEAD